MRFLIDGYNLLHAIGWAAKTSTGISWERSRTRMLDWLGQTHHHAAGQAWVIFDAHLVDHASPDTVYRNLNIVYSPHRQTADDRIEVMILSESHPRELVVISNDNRIQQAASRSGCQAWTCQRYLDWLVERDFTVTQGSAREEEPEKQEIATAAEIDEYLKIFEEPKKRLGKK